MAGNPPEKVLDLQISVYEAQNYGQKKVYILGGTFFSAFFLLNKNAPTEDFKLKKLVEKETQLKDLSQLSKIYDELIFPVSSKDHLELFILINKIERDFKPELVEKHFGKEWKEELVSEIIATYPEYFDFRKKAVESKEKDKTPNEPLKSLVDVKDKISNNLLDLLKTIHNEQSQKRLEEYLKPKFDIEEVTLIDSIEFDAERGIFHLVKNKIYEAFKIKEAYGKEKEAVETEKSLTFIFGTDTKQYYAPLIALDTAVKTNGFENGEKLFFISSMNTSDNTPLANAKLLEAQEMLADNPALAGGGYALCLEDPEAKRIVIHDVLNDFVKISSGLFNSFASKEPVGWIENGEFIENKKYEKPNLNNFYSFKKRNSNSRQERSPQEEYLANVAAPVLKGTKEDKKHMDKVSAALYSYWKYDTAFDAIIIEYDPKNMKLGTEEGEEAYKRLVEVLQANRKRGSKIFFNVPMKTNHDQNGSTIVHDIDPKKLYKSPPKDLTINESYEFLKRLSEETIKLEKEGRNRKEKNLVEITCESTHMCAIDAALGTKTIEHKKLDKDPIKWQKPKENGVNKPIKALESFFEKQNFPSIKLGFITFYGLYERTDKDRRDPSKKSGKSRGMAGSMLAIAKEGNFKGILIVGLPGAQLPNKIVNFFAETISPLLKYLGTTFYEQGQEFKNALTAKGKSVKKFIEGSKWPGYGAASESEKYKVEGCYETAQEIFDKKIKNEEAFKIKSTQPKERLRYF